VPAVGVGVADGRFPPPLLKLNAILNLGISAESGLLVRSAEARRSCASKSLLRRGVGKECGGSGRGHRGKGKEPWSRILNADHVFDETSNDDGCEQFFICCKYCEWLWVVVVALPCSRLWLHRWLCIVVLSLSVESLVPVKIARRWAWHISPARLPFRLKPYHCYVTVY